MDLSWKVAKEKVELSQRLFVLELEVEMIDVFEDWEVVRPIDHEYC